MALRRLCKSASASKDDECPAVYLDDADPTVMVSQGKSLDAAATSELRDVAGDEMAVRIPTETVLRAVGLFLAERGRPGVMAEVHAYLEENA